jgi:F-type H+-transporting ATPase subunit gamma
MSELVIMRQRMKAIGTIKKVTHAMRLISMSSHAQLKKKKAFLEEYKDALIAIISDILQSHSDWTNSILWPNQKDYRPIIIIVGSQKGLCGNFNTNLFNYIEKKIALINRNELHSIIVGKKAVDYVSEQNFGTIAIEFSEFTQGKLLSIAVKIADHIWHARKPYSSVTLYYNTSKTFFAQMPAIFELIPFKEHKALNKKINTHEAYRWEQDPNDILNALSHRFMQSIIQEILFQSLIAEQAARFIAMDSSTRNASNLLDSMRLDYNKLRQAKITRELTDLVASL